MYKLTIVAGPNRGASFPVQEGETSLGRIAGNTIVLPSVKVSKRHCTLVASNGEIVVRDQGSSNGTFVNGLLTKARKIKTGDRISIGDFVLEFTDSQAKKAAAAANKPQLAQVIPMPGMPQPPQSSIYAINPNQNGGHMTGVSGVEPEAPKDLKGKLIHVFERQFMPIFYGLNIKTEWRMIIFGLLIALMIGNVLISVSPLLDSNRKIVIRESGRRAAYMARELVERNAKVFGDQEYGKAEIGFTDRAEGVRLAILTDLDLRVIAPSTRANQYLTSGAEGSIAVRARELFKQGRETGLVAQADSFTVVAVEPIKVLDPRAGKNRAVGLGIVSIDTSIALPEGGEIGMIYSENLVIAGLLTLFVFIVIYRLTLKPFEVLNDDIDKVLKGEMRQVTHEFQITELDALWDVINSSLQRIQKPSGLSGGAGGATGMFSSGLGGGAGIDEWISGMKVLSSVPGVGVGFLDPDRRILSLNPTFEEVTGIRSESQVGVPLPDAARDQSFGLLTQDLLEKASASGPEGATDEFEITGVSYKITVSALGGNGAALKGFMVVLAKSGAE